MASVMMKSKRMSFLKILIPLHLNRYEEEIWNLNLPVTYINKSAHKVNIILQITQIRNQIKHERFSETQKMNEREVEVRSIERSNCNIIKQR